MKKSLFFILVSIIITPLLFGCTVSKDVEFKEFYTQVIGFTESEEISKPIQPDTILMMTNEDFLSFKDKYFTKRRIPIEPPDKEKAVLFLQIPSPTLSVNVYSIKNIKVSNNTLTIYLNKSSGVAEVSPAGSYNYLWEWVMFVEIDKSNLKDNMKIVIKK